MSEGSGISNDQWGAGAMDTDQKGEEQEKIPMMQQLLDNPFLLLFFGVMIPMVVYTLWGVIDILTIPLAK
ncbi:MAG: hypothetical protein CVV12_00275 [Gammaproteobacteria bacterium HGW-Gammaproteobacteria-2]|jgi:hypothetical protein|nr:MAG: hypothetical protein CVV12_00275 [Gammaproteobacteria bacterium HGW-Gammaproteobacteria-2]